MKPTKKLLVTGANGFVAGSVLAQAGEFWEVHALSRSAKPPLPKNIHWHIVDPLQSAQLIQVFQEIKSDAVIHAAAMADIDFCQSHPEFARKANVEFTACLAELCSNAGARLVFCSTDTIFDGEHAPYTEEDQPGPVNFYAQTKVEAEGIVSRLGSLGVIARLSLVFGLPVLGAGNSFLSRMLATLREGGAVKMTDHEIRTPVDVITVGRCLLELADNAYFGILHLAGHTRLNRLEMAKKIAVRFGFPETLVARQSVAAMSGRAMRPRDVSLDNAKVCLRLKTPMRTLDEGLSLILESAGNTSK